MGIKLKMTLWYTLLAVATAAMMGAMLLFAAQRSAHRYYSETLEAASLLARTTLEYDDNGLEIDDDLDDIPDVHITLYTDGGALIYGRTRVDLPFERGTVRRANSEGMDWYVLDTMLTFDWRGPVWLRCVKAADSEAAAYAPVFEAALVLLPLMIVLTAVGGFMIAKSAFRPVGRMASTADAIVNGGDLGLRVGLNEGTDELSRLSQTLDGMLARLDEAFQRERRFTSDAAHELRTPLNAIRLLCQEVMEQTDPLQKEALLTEILERTDGLGRLIAQLLALSRMDAGRLEVNMEATDVSRLMLDVAQELEPVALDAGITLMSEVESGVFLNADAALLTRLAVNLLSNAIRYGKSGGYAKLSLARESGQVVLSVMDDGIGMKREDQDHIWERFWRADSSRHSPGTGLGLSIAKWIIDRHNARAEVESELGKGTKIRVIFPG